MAPAQGNEPTTVASAVAYDSLSRTKAVTYHTDDGGVFATRTIDYDLGSRVVGETLAGGVTGSVANTYDALDRLTSRTTAGPAGAFEQGVTYNVSSLPLSVDYSALGSQWSITNTYAKTKQLRSRTAAGQTWDFSFAAAGQLSSAVSGVSLQTRSFDVYGRLQAVRDGRPSGSSYDNVLEAILTYDSQGSHLLPADRRRRIPSRLHRHLHLRRRRPPDGLAAHR